MCFGNFCPANFYFLFQPKFRLKYKILSDQFMKKKGIIPKMATIDSVPQYWDLLNEDDRECYLKLKKELSVENIKKGRNSKLDSFEGILDTIKAFVIKGNDNDWKRCLVCGICWMDESIGINTRQLRILLSKCKSSINGSLQKMGYTTNMSHAESWKILFPHIPLLKDHFNELRQWTIRQKGSPNQRSTKSKQDKTQINRQIKNKKNQDVIKDNFLLLKEQQEQFIQQKLLQKPNINQNNIELKQPSVPLKFRNKMNRIIKTDTG